MNNHTIIGSNGIGNNGETDRESGSDIVDESWALALLNEALDGHNAQDFETELQGSSQLGDELIIVEDSIAVEPSTPSAIEIQQQAFHEARRLAEQTQQLDSDERGLFLKIKEGLGFRRK